MRLFRSFKIFIALNLIFQSAYSQQEIAQPEVERILRVLASDSMEGRRAFTPAIDRAAQFIASEFKNAGLKPYGNSFLQKFRMIRTRFLSATGNVDGNPVDERNIAMLTSKPHSQITSSSGYEVVRIGSNDTFQTEVRRLLSQPRNFVLFVDSTHSRAFSALKRRGASFPGEGSILLMLVNEPPQSFNIEYRQEVTELLLTNVVGHLPGKRQNEMVIFSAHYDHLGIGKPSADGDSIYNGANDDAAGVTAVIMLAKHFSTKKHERTLLFAAFTAEEMGGYGSQYFSRQINPDQVMAMFNIEMIGTESKWGEKSAFITGYEKTDMGSILQKNLEGSDFTFYPDPYPQQQLFYRSDNATLARLGVPAHTISTSKMDVEKYYHTPDDEVETLNLKNMTEIIRAIALSSASIISGKHTPTRVTADQLR